MNSTFIPSLPDALQLRSLLSNNFFLLPNSLVHPPFAHLFRHRLVVRHLLIYSLVSQSVKCCIQIFSILFTLLLSFSFCTLYMPPWRYTIYSILRSPCKIFLCICSLFPSQSSLSIFYNFITSSPDSFIFFLIFFFVCIDPSQFGVHFSYYVIYRVSSH